MPLETTITLTRSLRFAGGPLTLKLAVDLLLEAGAELHPLGRVRWVEATRGEPMPGPSPICCFVLRGVKK